MGIGESKAKEFWLAFLRGLWQRGLTGVQRVISDAHEGLKAAIAQVLADEGYIEGFELLRDGARADLQIALKYYAGRPVIEHIERVSRPGLRIYRGRNAIPQVMNGLGVAIVSTPKGVMTDRKARQVGVGGEVLCYVA